MGIPYVLVKRDKPEVFNLGKGSARGRGWWEVFERRLNLAGLFGCDGLGNFHEPLHNLDFDRLAGRIREYDSGYSGEDAEEIALRIIEWMSDDVCILSNCWEELESMVEEGTSQDIIAEEFSDIQGVISLPLSTYRETGNVWGA